MLTVRLCKENKIMGFDLRTRLAALALPLALLALPQSGACGKSGGSAGTTNAENISANRAVTANTNGAAGEAQSNVNGGETVAGTVAKGGWGGEHVRLDVSDEGAEIEFDCAHGRMGRLTTDAAGKFDVKGVFILERGGPITPDDKEQTRPARYSGRVEGKRMRLTVTLTDTDKDAEPMVFTLTHGAEANLVKCY
jgi:hypothetical protein